MYMSDRYHIINIHDYVDTDEYMNIKLETNDMEYFWVCLDGKELIFETDIIKFYGITYGTDILLSDGMYPKDFNILIERVTSKMAEIVDVPSMLINAISNGNSIRIHLRDTCKEMINANYNEIEGVKFSFKFDICKADYLNHDGKPIYSMILSMPHFEIKFSN